MLWLAGLIRFFQPNGVASPSRNRPAAGHLHAAQPPVHPPSTGVDPCRPPFSPCPSSPFSSKAQVQPPNQKQRPAGGKIPPRFAGVNLPGSQLVPSGASGRCTCNGNAATEIAAISVSCSACQTDSLVQYQPGTAPPQPRGGAPPGHHAASCRFQSRVARTQPLGTHSPNSPSAGHFSERTEHHPACIRRLPSVEGSRLVRRRGTGFSLPSGMRFSIPVFS